MGEYPSLARVSCKAETAGLGMQIVFDTYTQTLHDKCKRLYDKIRQGDYRNPSPEEKTCEVYIEIVLTVVEPSWVGVFRELREAVEVGARPGEVSIV
jgi:hypothetical protein